MARIPKRVLKIAKDLHNGQRPRKFRVRAVLKWFGASRRGTSILAEVQSTLANVGLTTDPALDRAGIDDPIRFVTLPQSGLPVLLDVREDNPQQMATEIVPVVPTPASDTGRNGNSSSDSNDELESDLEEEVPVGKPDDRPVTSQISDWTISSLRDKLDRGQLVLQPKFQREYV